MVGSVEGLPLRAVLDAVKQWIRKPLEDQAARPHELRAMAEAEVGRSPAPTAAELADVQRRYVASGYGDNWAHAIKEFPGAPEAPQVPRAKYRDMLRVAEPLEKIARPTPASVGK